MLRLTQLLALTLITALIATSCHSAKRLSESGDYDDAIRVAVQQLRGKKKKKTEYVQVLEIAFRKAHERDMRVTNALAAEGRPENWERINRIHRQIRERQDKVTPLLPLVSKDGYHAKFEFVKIEQLELESREKAAEYLYARAQELLRKGQNGDKAAARQAYQTLCDLEQRYFQHYKDKEQLQRDARYFGTVHILFEIKNQSNKVLPRSFNDKVLAISKYDLDTEWKSYHFAPQTGVAFDYRVVFNIRQVDLSPERVREREYTDERDIQDGWEYVLDGRGNVVKDSLGNDVKKPRFVRIKAFVLESYQTKAVRLTGAVEIYNADNNARLYSKDLGTEVLFENYASTFRGDQRALSDESRQRIGNHPLPFPADDDMLAQAADRLKPNLQEELRRSPVLY